MWSNFPSPVTPYHSSCYANFENGDKLLAFQAQLKSLPNVELIDWGRMDYPDTFFKDTTHLRQEGAIDFSQKLGEKIRGILSYRLSASHPQAVPTTVTKP